MQPKLNWYEAQLNNVDEEDEQGLDIDLQMSCLCIGALLDALDVPALFASQ